MTTTAVYAIFCDEARHVAQWAETTGDADYRFVLDTGSTDNTVDELDRHGIEWALAAIDPFRFDDARNMALAMVPTDIDFCLQLDADEILNDGWRAAFDAVADLGVPRYRYRWENWGNASWGVVHRTNLHARHGFRWHYPVHEVLEPHAATLDVPGLVIQHRPDESKSRGGYLDLLARAARDDPNDHRMAFYYGRELNYHGTWALAREQLGRFLALPGGWPPERAEAYRILAAMDDYPERWLWKAVGECPERREPFCDLARLYLQREQADLARSTLKLAEQRTDQAIYTTSRNCWGAAFDALVNDAACAASGWDTRDAASNDASIVA